MPERTKGNECYDCIHRRVVPGNAHIRCAQPDPDMKGNEMAARNGWFWYPGLFDPRWKLNDCANWASKEDRS